MKSEMFNLRKLFIAAVRRTGGCRTVGRPIVIAFFSVWMMINPASAQTGKTIKVADGVYAYSDPYAGASMFVVTNDGVIVVDPKNSRFSKAMLQAIRSVTKQPIRYLLYSHNHWDHSNGGQVFRDEGATIIAHVEAYEWLKANPNQDLVLPDETWAGNRKDIVIGGKTLELHYLGMNHGLGMTVFLLPKEKVVYIIDLVDPGQLLFTTAPDYNVKELGRSLGEIEAMDFEKAIYVHGYPAVGSKKEVIVFHEYLNDLKAAVFAEFKKGTNFMDVANAVKLPKYEKWFKYQEWLPMNAWKIVLEMGAGPYPWRPTHPYEEVKSSGSEVKKN